MVWRVHDGSIGALRGSQWEAGGSSSHIFPHEFSKKGENAGPSLATRVISNVRLSTLSIRSIRRAFLQRSFLSVLLFSY